MLKNAETPAWQAVRFAELRYVYQQLWAVYQPQKFIAEL
jgi:hypothetical protein